MKTKSVVIVGAGIGGITAATHLAKSGLQVTVVEKNDNPGGRCDRHVHDGHIFDTGPTLLVMPLLYEAEFNALGSSLQEALSLQRVDPTYHVFFDDNSHLALTSDMKSLQEQLEAIQPGSFSGLLRYLNEGERHYRLSMQKLVYPDFRTAGDFFKLSSLPLLYQVKPTIKHYTNMRRYFTNPRLKSAFTFQDVYLGLSPFEAPATFSMMPYTELAHGVWYPKGGMYQVVEALVKLARQAGVEFTFDAEVERIDVANGRTRGVMLGGQRLEADIVLVNADLPYAYNTLLPGDPQARKLDRKRYSCSVISFYWGVDQPYPSLPPHSLFLADDYRQNFDSIIQDLTLPSNPSLYIHAPTHLDPSMAPEGQDTLIAIVPVGHISEHADQDWEALRDQARLQVFRRLKVLDVHDLEAHIKFEVSYIPPSWRKLYNLAKGSTHGLCHNLGQLGIFRPDFRHPQVGNLYFVGASTRPGTGIPTTMISGRLSARRILDDLQAQG